MRGSNYTSYKTTSNFNLLKVFSLVFVFGTFSYIIYYAATNQDTLSQDDSQVELISPLAGAVKERAENPGGMEIPNQDKQVFDLLEESATEEVAMNQEELCAGESGAILCNKEVNKVQPLTHKVEEKTEEVVATAKEAVEKVENKVEEKVQTIASLVESADTADAMTDTQKAQVAAAEKTIATIAPAAGPTAEKMKTEAKAEIAKQVAEGTATPKGAGFGIQLASYGSMDGANTGVAYYRKKVSGLLDGLTYYTESVDVKGRTYYRVQMFGLDSKQAAADLCGKIKAQNENCLPIVR